MAAADEQDLLMIGRVIRSHGVIGEVKVLPESDDPERLLDLSEVFIGKDETAALPFEVTQARFQQTKKGLVILMSFAGVKGRDAADALRHQFVFATKNELPPLEDGEFYLHELIGSHVETNEGEAVGTLKEILELPAYNLYVVQRPGQKDAMIPAVPAFIETIDVEAQRIVIQPIEGLLDI
ncbi:MAG: ribosome maturation factor RimM [Bacteroidota bacterium]